jgi:hypothetical protein
VRVQRKTGRSDRWEGHLFEGGNVEGDWRKRYQSEKCDEGTVEMVGWIEEQVIDAIVWKPRREDEGTSREVKWSRTERWRDLL